MADALGAGRSIRTAIADAAAGAEGAARHELGAAARALALGEPTDAVLLGCARARGTHAWDTLTAAVLLQRDAGGDLAGLLRELAASGEAADRAERDARAATAQARFTAWLVLGLPLAGARHGRARRTGLRRVAAREPALGLARRAGGDPPARGLSPHRPARPGDDHDAARSCWRSPPGCSRRGGDRRARRGAARPRGGAGGSRAGARAALARRLGRREAPGGLAARVDAAGAARRRRARSWRRSSAARRR